MPRSIGRPHSGAFELTPEQLRNAPDAWFGRPAPLEVDAGCGNGAFLMQRAARHPERNILGIDRLLGRTIRSCRRIERAELAHVRVIRAEIGRTIEDHLRDGSTTIFHVLFPDPWPKRRHEIRRLLQPTFLKLLTAKLITRGEIRFRTDSAPYFQFVEKCVANFSGELERVDWRIPEDYPTSQFELRFRALGLPVYSMKLVKR